MLFLTKSGKITAWRHLLGEKVISEKYWEAGLYSLHNNILVRLCQQIFWPFLTLAYFLVKIQGDILVMDIHGNTVGKANLRPGVAITEMAWNCERFNMEEQTESQNNLTLFPPTSNQQPKQPKPYLRPDGE